MNQGLSVFLYQFCIGLEVFCQSNLFNFPPLALQGFEGFLSIFLSVRSTFQLFSTSLIRVWRYFIDQLFNQINLSVFLHSFPLVFGGFSLILKLFFNVPNGAWSSSSIVILLFSSTNPTRIWKFFHWSTFGYSSWGSQTRRYFLANIDWHFFMALFGARSMSKGLLVFY